LTPCSASRYAVGVQTTSGGTGGEAPSGEARGNRRNEARRRSFCFLERGGDRWSVFLATYAGEDGWWRGYFAFRTGAPGLEGVEIRTADVFVEPSEGEVDARARGLGRPLLQSLLESALHSHERQRGASPDVSRWFRTLLANRGGALAERHGGTGTPSLSRLKSLYDSYRMDQVSHLIALIGPEAFRLVVEQVLDGREIDFRASDRLQLAMLVMQELERHLPLPPFEAWAEDYLSRPDVYHRYSHELHREAALPE
jgi:hypothetical protein